ncbi:MAG: CBS and ACT domain-containing protein [Deltaproteobacteria bacterium]|nr:CBS and ACT domain-containing protein [Deltaproteobacteria bacterium]
MLVKDWMTREVISVDEDVSIMKASALMREKGFQHLPVLRQGRLTGIVSDRDLKEAHPSKATTLDIHELYYLLDKLKVEKVMSKNPHTLGGHETTEKAAALMLKYDISALPVVDQKGDLQGIITKGDVFRAMVSVSGIYQAPLQLCVEVEDRPGAIREVTDVIRAYGGRMVSMISTYEQATKGFRHLYIRTKDVENEEALFAELEGKFKLIYRIHDELD